MSMSHLDADEEAMEGFHFDEDEITGVTEDESEEDGEDMIDPVKDAFFTQTYDV